MMMRVVLVLTGLVFLSACVATRPDQPNSLSSYAAGHYEQVFAKTKLMSDPHTGRTFVLGPQVRQDGFHSGTIFLVRTRVDEGGGKDRYAIEVAGLFPKRVYLGDVYSQGRKLKSKVLDRERGDCGYNCTTVETVLVRLTEAEMESYAADGLTLKVTGRRDSIVVSIPASYFAAVLAFHRRHTAYLAS